MIQEEIEKNAVRPVCLECLTTDLFFTSNDYLYHGKCFGKLNFKSPISRQDFLYYFPQSKIVNDKVYFDKETESILRMIFIEDGFDKDGFNRKRFDRNGFNRKGLMIVDIIAIKN